MKTTTWSPPASWTRITCIDAHTAGEPLRIFTSGFDEPPGATMLEKRRYARDHLDHLRRATMFEPRGHADMYGCLPTAPVTSDGHLGVLFLHNEGYSTMCGHGIIAMVTVGLECGLLEPALDEVRIDTPAGRVTAFPHWQGSRVARVSFENVPSFLLQADVQVEVPGLGQVSCDIAFGGAFYAYVQGESLGLSPESPAPLIDAGMRIKRALMKSHELVHPAGQADLNFLYGTIFVWPGREPGRSRNVCIFAEGEVDRSPTGTGVSGRAAIEHARGRLALGTPLTVESILRTEFQVRALREVPCGALTAIVPEVTGSAFVTGRNELLLDPLDPLRHGFFLR